MRPRNGAAVLLAACACSPGYHHALPARPTTASPGPLAEEEALRAQIEPAPWHVAATLDRASAAAGGTLVLRGTSDCGFLSSFLVLEGANGYPDPRPLAPVTVAPDRPFVIRAVVPRGTPAQDAHVEVSTGCGPAEADALAVLPLRITG